jgi:uncharacterized protein YqfB (UPF0267 family)
MLFKYRFHSDIENGRVMLTFRDWKKPHVKEGGRYRLNEDGVLEVLSVRTVALSDIPELEAKRAGFADRVGLLGFIGPGSDSVYRIEFRYVREPYDATQSISAQTDITDEDVTKLVARLDRIDRVSVRGPWAWKTLDLISRHPRVRAPDLAKRLGWETQPFKANVRRLKALGLTISHEVGYELSPRGRAFLAAAKARDRS